MKVKNEINMNFIDQTYRALSSYSGELSDGERRLHRRRLRRKRLTGNGTSTGTPRLGIW